MVIEVCSAFGVSWWLWNFSMCIEFFYVNWTFLWLWNFSMLVELSNVDENFLDLYNFSMLVHFFHAYGTFTCSWNCPIHRQFFFLCLWNFFFMLVEVFHAHIIFPFSQNVSMLMELFHFPAFLDFVVFQFSWNFWLFLLLQTMFEDIV